MPPIRRARQPRPFEIDVVDRILERVVSLRDAGATEGVRLDDVGARGKVFVVDRADDIRPGEDQDVAIPLQIAGMIRESSAAEIRFRQSVALDHGPHRAVEDEDALRQVLSEPGSGRCVSHSTSVYPSVPVYGRRQSTP